MLNIEGDADWLETMQAGLAEIGAMLDAALAPIEQELSALLQDLDAA